MKKIPHLIFGAIFMMVSSFSLLHAQEVTVSAYLAYDIAQAQNLTNPVDVFETGASSSNNVPNNTEFTLDFGTGLDGLNLGTATFSVFTNFENGGNGQNIRQFNNSILGPREAGEEITVTLTDLSNLASLSLVRISLRGADTSGFTASLPNGSTSTGASDTPSLWEVGQTLVFGNSSLTTLGYNIGGFETVATIPEPGFGALLIGFTALGLILIRRRRRN